MTWADENSTCNNFRTVVALIGKIEFFRTFSKYLQRRAVLRPLQGRGSLPATLDSAVVIPVLAEYSTLAATLTSLAQLPAAELARTAVLVIVNNPPPDLFPTHISETRSRSMLTDNQALLRALPQLAGNLPYPLFWIDAATPGNELPPKTGVGMARKIACDSLLAGLNSAAGPEAAAEIVIFHLDADTLVGRNYLQAGQLLRQSRKPGAVLAFTHQQGESSEQRQAIRDYELHLHYFVQGLRFAGSAYAFHTVGSTMLSSGAAYVRAGGMPGERLAGEDFYFLQQLQKTGGVLRVGGICVHPSPRGSDRVLFGTGAKVAAQISACKDSPCFRTYDFRVFKALRELLRTVESVAGAVEADAVKTQDILHELRTPQLGYFLEKAGFTKVWPGFVRQHKLPAARLKAFHDWFDGLATVRLIRYLSTELWPDVPLPTAWNDFLLETGTDNVKTDDKDALLEWCRKTEWPDNNDG